MKSLLITFALLISSLVHAQDDDTSKFQAYRQYIKDTSGVIHYYDDIKMIFNVYSCYDKDEVTNYKPNEISSGFMQFGGSERHQFIMGKIKKVGKQKMLVKGNKRFNVLINDNGTLLLLDYTSNSLSTNSNPSYQGFSTTTASTNEKYYLVQNSVVTSVSFFPKKIVGWDKIFTGCPAHKIIFEQFYTREKGDLWTVQDLVGILSELYFQECYLEL